MRVVLLVLTFILPSCRDKRLDNDATQSIVDGLWVSDCMTNELGQLKSTLKFSFADRVEKVDTQYDEDCNREIHQVRYEGTYELEVTWESYLYNLELRVEKLSLKMFDPDMANQQSVCEYDQWTDDAADVENLGLRNCPLRVFESFRYRTFLKLKDNQLILSKSFGSSEEDPNGFEGADISGTFTRSL